jgi:hypothetical protein
MPLELTSSLNSYYTSAVSVVGPHEIKNHLALYLSDPAEKILSGFTICAGPQSLTGI